MFQKIFWVITVLLLILTGLSNPVVVQSFLYETPTPTPTLVPPTTTSTPTVTRDPFANIPLATPQTNDSALVAVSVQELPSPLGELPPTFTPTPEAQNVIELLPDPALIYQSGDAPNFQRLPTAPAPMSGPTPDRVKIKKLNIDARIQPVGVMPVQISSAPNDAFVAPAAPSSTQTVGWLNVSAPFGQVGNTVLLGSHRQDTGLYGLWSLAAGDTITLFAQKESRTYIVAEILILLEQNQPVEIRQANARHTQFTNHEQLTLVTGGPEGGVQRTVVIAYPSKK